MKEQGKKTGSRCTGHGCTVGQTKEREAKERGDCYWSAGVGVDWSTHFHLRGESGDQYGSLMDSGMQLLDTV